jgi:hypothetical protein
VLAKSTEFPFELESFRKNIVHETYTDIMKSDQLSRFIFEHEGPSLEKVDLTRLSGVNPDQVQVSATGAVTNPVGLVLRVAEMNLEIAMSICSGGTDLYIAQGAVDLLQQKVARSGIADIRVSGFSALLELNNLPDIGAAVAENSIPLAEVWRIRQRGTSRRFRTWLRDAQPKDSRDLEKAYVAALSGQSLVSSLPVKSLRFSVTFLTGLAQPIAGFIASGLDSLFVEKWLSGYTPKLFFDKLRKIATR